jgi:hypothetical protein
MKQNVAFACDCMCGKLAKRLRMLGFDAFYKKFILDSDLVDMCEEENRILLTKDTGIIKRQTNADVYIVNGKNPDEEIVEVIEEFDLKKRAKPFSRCINCGNILKDVDKYKVIHDVPEYVYQTQDQFAKCCGCGKIYWSATHKYKMDSYIEKWLS